MPWLRAPSYAATSASLVRAKLLELWHSIGSSLIPDLQQQSRSKLSELRQAVVVLEVGYPPELRGALRRADGRLRVVDAPLLDQVQRQLVLGEAHLDDAVGVAVQVERVYVVGLPPVEVGRVLAVAVAGGDPREELSAAATHLASVGFPEDRRQRAVKGERAAKRSAVS
jgi:hypothetical protein